MMATTKVSSKGQIVLPKALRDARGWNPGTELEVAEGSNGEVVLFPAKKIDRRFPKITAEEFLARRFKYDGPPVTDEMMDQAVLDEARRRFNAVRR
jgi:AbrB family looped-hinge helix DNA binding protein